MHREPPGLKEPVRRPVRGFTVVELLVSAAIVLSVMGVALVVLAQGRDSLERDGTGIESAQRLRAGLEVLTHDVGLAGAGPEADSWSLSLAHAAPAVELLRPTGVGAADGERFQALRVISAPRDAAHGRLADSGGSGAALRLAPPPECPALPACGFQAGMTVIVYDGSGAFDLATVSAVDPALASIAVDPPVGRVYPGGAIVSEVGVSMFEVDVAADGSGRLMRRTTGAAQPMVDAVVAFTVAALGEATPPSPGRGPRSPPTYGPVPPLPGIDDPRDPWAAGENCTMTRDADGAPLARLPALAGSGALIALGPAQLDDGPWCPASGGGVYDADLFRLRRLDLRLRVESAAARLRGPASALFTRGGHGRPTTWVPDLELRVSVTLPNLMRR